MAKDAAKIQMPYAFRRLLDIQESLFVQKLKITGSLIWIFLLHRLLPPNRFDVLKNKRKSSRFFVEENLLFRRAINQVPLRCLTVTR